MRVLIVSEGASELGTAEHAGSLGVLVERLRAERNEKLEFESITVRHPELVRFHGKGGGMEKKAISCLRYAEKKGYEAVVLVIDQDDEKYKYRRNEIAKAQASDKYAGIRRAMGVAVLTFDAWVLADEVALSKVVEKTVSAQPDPEGISDAKSHCRLLREEHGCAMRMAEFYTLVAGHARLKVWEERCAEGFGVFARRVREM
jgi:hypothetical protein